MNGDVLGGDVRRFQLATVGRAEIQEESASAAAADELSGKLCRDLSSHFVAADSDGGSEPGPHILRPFAERDESGHARRRGVFRGAAPARVNDSDGPPPGQDDRNAVGRLHDQADAGQVSSERVALARILDFSFGGSLPDCHRAVTVDLRRAHERDSVQTERGREPAAEEAGRGRLALRRGSTARECDHDSGRRANRPEDRYAILRLFEPVAACHGGIVGGWVAESRKLRAVRFSVRIPQCPRSKPLTGRGFSPSSGLRCMPSS
jgi:hypothetical protein